MPKWSPMATKRWSRRWRPPTPAWVSRAPVSVAYLPAWAEQHARRGPLCHHRLQRATSIGCLDVVAILTWRRCCGRRQRDAHTTVRCQGRRGHHHHAAAAPVDCLCGHCVAAHSVLGVLVLPRSRQDCRCRRTSSGNHCCYSDGHRAGGAPLLNSTHARWPSPPPPKRVKSATATATHLFEYQHYHGITFYYIIPVYLGSVQILKMRTLPHVFG
jgi:hypothetical protein